MCTAILLLGVLPSHPIVLAGNRDEFLERRSRGMQLWNVAAAGGTVRILAGRDEEAGGTWFGINQYGLIAGLTNRYTGTRDPAKLSRGKLVLQCLSQKSPEEAIAAVTGEGTAKYNPFNLFCVNLESGFFFTNFPLALSSSLVSGQIHVFTNRAFEDPQDRKVLRVRENLEDVPLELASVQPVILELLKRHAEDSRHEPFCVHLDGYGTVSSLFLAVGRRLQDSILLSSDGPPCQSSYQDLTEGLLQLLRITLVY